MYSSASNYNYSEHSRMQQGLPPESPMARMRQNFWTAKQALKSALGRKEDDHLVSSDAELDSKLATYLALKQSCENMLRCIERYQDFICDLSQEESTLGRFLKHHGKEDKTQAGKMMIAVGRAESFTAQQRLALRVPLVRLYAELEVFVERAIEDCQVTVERCERARVEYRGSLMWMKKVSEQLDPDTYRQMDKFRKVQATVKQNKAKFDRRKLDCLQKVDLLIASRCNLFSKLMANYQNCLLSFSDRVVQAHSTVADNFSGYQHYEFTVCKELAEPTRKNIELCKGRKDGEEAEEEEDAQADTLINLSAEQKNNEQRAEAEDSGGGSIDALLLMDSPENENKPMPSTMSTVDSQLDDLLSGVGQSQASNATPNTAIPRLDPPPGWMGRAQTQQTDAHNLMDGCTDDDRMINAGNAVSQLLDALSLPAGDQTSKLNATGQSTAVNQDSSFVAQQLFDEVMHDAPADTNSFAYQWQNTFGPTDNEHVVQTEHMQTHMHTQVGAHTQPNTSATAGMGMMAQMATQPVPSQAISKQQESPLHVSKTVLPSHLLDMKATPPPANQKTSSDAKKADWFNMFADIDPLKNTNMDGGL